ncbi:MAG: dethiobiotin synthase [Pseudomonadota bacterium]
MAWAIEQVFDSGTSSPPPPRPAIPRRGRLDLLPGRRPRSTPPRILVTGTDTGVGKTVAAAALGLAARAAGLGVACWKPVESGVPRGHGEGPDQSLYRALGLAAPRDRWPVTGYRAPVSPHLAARSEGRVVDVEDLVERLRRGDEPLLVEGAGGLLVPLEGTTTWADLALRADLGALVVAPNRLGCLNQVFSAVYLLRTMGIAVCGVILNDHRKDGTDLSSGSNADELERYLGDLFLGVLPDLPALGTAALPPEVAGIARKIWHF